MSYRALSRFDPRFVRWVKTGFLQRFKEVVIKKKALSGKALFCE